MSSNPSSPASSSSSSTARSAGAPPARFGPGGGVLSGLGLKLLGTCAALLMATVLVLGLGVTKPDVVQGEAVRLIYIHPAIAWTMYTAIAVGLGSGLLWLWPRTRRATLDHFIGAATELAALFCALTLITGSIWGRPTWGGWWDWDPRLTSTAVEFVLLLGVVALRRIPSTLDSRARRSTVALAIVAANIPIVHFSVEWWRGLHQTASLLKRNALHPEIRNLQLITMLLSFVAFSLTFAWLLIVRARTLGLVEHTIDGGLDVAIAERRAEAHTIRVTAPAAPASSAPITTAPITTAPITNAPITNAPITNSGAMR